MSDATAEAGTPAPAFGSMTEADRAAPRRQVGTAPIGALLLLAASLAFFARRSWHGLHVLQFGDEAQHLLAAKAIAAGDRLYRDFIDWHGPVVYIAAQLFGLLADWRDPISARLVPPLLALLSAGVVASATCLAGPGARLIAAAATLGLLATVWLVQGLHLFLYEPFGSVCAILALAWLAVPAWLDAPLPLWRVAAAGAALALLAFTAYSFAPSALLFGASGILAAGDAQARRLAPPLLAGAAVAALAVLLWLAIFSDIVGLVVFHVLVNQLYYGRDIGFTWHTFLAGWVLGTTPDKLVQDLAIGAGSLAIVLCLGLTTRRPGAPRRVAAVLLGAAALMLLNARGTTGFQNGTELSAAIGLAALAIAALLSRLRAAPGGRWIETAVAIAIAGVIAAAELVERRALSSPWRQTRAAMITEPAASYAPQDDALSRTIRALVAPDERILVLVFRPEIYLRADRLPMRKYYEYLPWEAAYARAPRLGRDRDLCADLRADPPPVVYYDHWTVWDRYPVSSFMPCVDAILAERFTPHPSLPDLHVRNDRAAARGLARTPGAPESSGGRGGGRGG